MAGSWQVVRVEAVPPARKRLWFVIDGQASVPVVIDAELDTPDRREKIADTLREERYRVHRPGGPRSYTPSSTPPSLGG